MSDLLSTALFSNLGFDVTDSRENTMLPTDIADALVSSPVQGFDRVVVFSGAGMSAESGIPTFRSGPSALWADFRPEDLATPEAWRRDRERVWAWYEWRRGLVMRCQPHAGHLAVGRLQQRLGAAVITQNVDDLHERGGAAEVMHLHGSLFAPRCEGCAAPRPLSSGLPDGAHARLKPPACAACGQSVRPGVVWFGEMLDGRLLDQAADLISRCDLLLVVGTSGQVQPAASLVEVAPASAVIIEINP